jgi:hypothetical protein
MTTVQTVPFSRLLQVDWKGALDPQFVHSAVAAMNRSQTFWRSARGVILYQPDRRFPRELVGVTTPLELEAILRSGDAIKLTGDTLTGEEMAELCKAIQANRSRLPSARLRFGAQS